MNLISDLEENLNEIYIHYGSKQYDPQKFMPIKNQILQIKPEGGLWASPIGCDFGWKEWCERNEFRDCTDENSFRFKLSDNANLLIINSVDDLNGLPVVENPLIKISMWICLDFEKLVEDGVDAIQVNMSSDSSRGKPGDGLYFKLYGWDCDSILVLNKNIIEPL